MSENWLEKWYKDNYASASAEKPRASIWSRIEAGLRAMGVNWQDPGLEPVIEHPKASVWEALSAFVDNEILLRRQIRIRRIRTAFSSVLLIFVPFLLADLSNAETWNSEEYAALAELNKPSNNSEPQANNNERANVPNVPNQLAVLNAELIPVQGTAEVLNLNSESNETRVPSNSNSEDLGLNAERSSELAQTNVSSIDLLPIKPFAYEDFELKNEQVAARLTSPGFTTGRWSLGLSGNYQLTNLYNPITRLGLDSKSHITNLFESNFSFDIAVFRRISTRSSVRLGLRLNDQKAQSYQDFDNAQYLVKDLELNYQTLDISYNRAIATAILPPRIGVELSTGLYVGYLTSIKERVNHQDQKLLSDGFRNYDLGINIGLHGIYKFSRPVHLSLGVFYSNGLINIFQGVEKIPARFYQTYTSSYGASLGVRYLLNQ